MERNSVSANGIDFVYLETGPADGPLVLCFHGFPDHAPTYEPLLADLGAAGFHGVAPWMRGYAPTSLAPDGKYHTTYLASDVVALSDALSPSEQVHLIGHDWGAGAVTLAASYRPERVRRLVTIAVPPGNVIGGRFLSSPDQLKRSWYIWFFQTPLADAGFAMNDFAFVDKLWADWSPGYTPPQEFMRALKNTYASDGSAHAALDYYRHSFGGQVAPEGDAAAIAAAASNTHSIPHLYFHGREDGCLGFELIDEDALKAAVAPHGDYEIVEETGHFLHLERPDLVNPKIVDFLSA